MSNIEIDNNAFLDKYRATLERAISDECNHWEKSERQRVYIKHRLEILEKQRDGALDQKTSLSIEFWNLILKYSSEIEALNDVIDMLNKEIGENLALVKKYRDLDVKRSYEHHNKNLFREEEAKK